MHISTPPISPKTIPIGPTAARLALSTDCPGCAEAPDRGLIEAIVAATYRIPEPGIDWDVFSDEQNFARALLAIALRDSSAGADGPQVISAAQVYLAQLDESANHYFDEMARVESRICKARRKWGRRFARRWYSSLAMDGKKVEQGTWNTPGERVEEEGEKGKGKGKGRNQKLRLKRVGKSKGVVKIRVAGKLRKSTALLWTGYCGHGAAGYLASERLEFM